MRGSRERCGFDRPAAAARRILLSALLAETLLASTGWGQEVSELRVREAIEDGAGALGQAIGGGSPLSGPASTTGGLGRLRLGAAATFLDLEIEDPQRSAGTIGFVLPTATVNAAVGILGGGPSGFGALDVIGRVGPVLPRDEIDQSPLLFSLGARIGILREGILFPDVSVSIARTWVDDLRYGQDADEITFSGEVRNFSMRADVSKTFLLATPYAGLGFDRGEVEVGYRIPAERSTGDEEIRGDIEVSNTRGRAYVGVELGLVLLAIAAEIGTAGGDTFAAIGTRIGL